MIPNSTVGVKGNLPVGEMSRTEFEDAAARLRADGLTYQAVADALGSNPGTVSWMVQKATRRSADLAVAIERMEHQKAEARRNFEDLCLRTYTEKGSIKAASEVLGRSACVVYQAVRGAVWRSTRRWSGLDLPVAFIAGREIGGRDLEDVAHRLTALGKSQKDVADLLGQPLGVIHEAVWRASGRGVGRKAELWRAEDEALSLYEQMGSCSAVAARMGCAPGTIWKRVQRARARRVEGLTPTERKRIEQASKAAVVAGLRKRQREEAQQRRQVEHERLTGLADRWTDGVEWRAQQRRLGDAWTAHPADLPISTQPVRREERGFEASMPELIRRYGSGGWEMVFAHATLGQVRRFQQVSLEVVVDTTTGLGYGLDGGVTPGFTTEPPVFTGRSGIIEVEPGNEVSTFFWGGLDFVEGDRGFRFQGRSIELTDREKKRLRRNGRSK